MPLGSITKTGDLKLGTQKQVGMLMKKHLALLGFTAKIKGFELGAQPSCSFTPYNKGPSLVEDDETIGREFLCWSFRDNSSSICSKK
jgi:hypothetical protein